MARTGIQALLLSMVTLAPAAAHAVASAEVYTAAPEGYGRFEARLKFAAGDGVVSSFFLWKDGSEVSGTFWNELDFEKLGADCHVETNAIYGNPPSNNNAVATFSGDPCSGYHVYAYEWTPEAIVWLVDGVEVRRDNAAAAAAFRDNASSAGMQLRFNVWPGDESFGGNFNPNILPVHQYIDWIQFSSYQNGQFTLDWREDFNGGTLPAGFLTANWSSPKNLSTHAPGNVNFIDGYLVLSLTADNAIGPNGAMPNDSGGGAGGAGGSGSGAGGGGTGGTSGGAGGGGVPSSGGAGATSAGGTGGVAGSGATSGGGADGSGGAAAGAGAGGASGAGAGAGPSAGGASGAGAGAGPSAGGASGVGAGGATGGASGTGAVSGASGSAGASGSIGAPADDDPETGGGCGCRTAGTGKPQAPWAALGLAALAAVRRRRRSV